MQFNSIEKIKHTGIKVKWDKVKYSRIRKEGKKAIRSKRLMANWIKENF